MLFGEPRRQDREMLALTRTVILQGEIHDAMVENFISAFSYLLHCDRKKPVLLYLDSYGGSVTDAIAILDVIDASPVPIYTVAQGAAYSAAAVILTLAQEGRRFISKRTSVMFHAARGAQANDLLENLKNQASFFQSIDQDLSKEVCKRTNFVFKEFSTMMENGAEIWMKAPEVLKKKVADHKWSRTWSKKINKEIGK